MKGFRQRYILFIFLILTACVENVKKSRSLSLISKPNTDVSVSISSLNFSCLGAYCNNTSTTSQLQIEGNCSEEGNDYVTIYLSYTPLGTPITAGDIVTKTTWKANCTGGKFIDRNNNISYNYSDGTYYLHVKTCRANSTSCAYDYKTITTNDDNDCITSNSNSCSSTVPADNTCSTYSCDIIDTSSCDDGSGNNNNSTISVDICNCTSVTNHLGTWSYVGVGQKEVSGCNLGTCQEAEDIRIDNYAADLNNTSCNVDNTNNTNQVYDRFYNEWVNSLGSLCTENTNNCN